MIGEEELDLFCYYIYKFVVVKMREGVLPLNIVISVFYIILAGLIGFILKRSSRSLKRVEVGQGEEGWREAVQHNRVLALSWVKKYSLVGAFFNEDKKYLLKEFVFVAAYAAACLHINHIILWPVALSLLFLPVTFLLYDLLLKKAHFLKVAEGTNVQHVQQRANAIRNQGQSQIEIETVNIDAIPAVSAQPIRPTNEQVKAKEEERMERSNFQVILNCLIGFTSIVLLFQTVMTLTNSISNSGELNITSVLIIFSIDQFTIRPAAGLLLFITIKIVERYSQSAIIDNFMVSALCQEELREAISEYVKEKRRKQQEMTASPPRRKQESPSRVPKASLPSGDQPTYLNLINLQPTRRKTEKEEQEEVSPGLEQIYLTTLEQEMFDGAEEQRQGSATKRKANKENKQHSYLSAVQKFTIEEEEHSEDLEIKQDPLQECHFNRIIDLFNYNLSPTSPRHNLPYYNYDLSPANYTKRRPPMRKKHKRVLNLTGSSPYLEYLPNMLKNVDKFKTNPKETRVL